jgi:enhancing lycopene biosynthesis protein 2
VILSRILGSDRLPHQLTIGSDAGTAAALATMGTQHVPCPVREFVVDKTNKIISTPAYMLAGSIAEAADGIEKCVKALVGLID